MPEGQERLGVALVVGVGAYAHADLTALPCAVHDARAVARLLIHPEICRFPRERVKLLTDAKADRNSLVRAMSRWLPEAARGAEVVLLFFAGHGMVGRVGQREEGYLLPYDADPRDLATHGIAMRDVAKWVEAVEAHAVVVCLDCCHAGKVLSRAATPEPTFRVVGLRPSVLPALTGEGRFLIASCGEGEYSLEVPELRHGLFTYHLLRGLEGSADRDQDGRVGVAELFEHVSAAVIRESKEKYGRLQKPWKNSTDTGGVDLSTPPAEGMAKAGPDVTALKKLWRTSGSAAALAEAERLAAVGPSSGDSHTLTGTALAEAERLAAVGPYRIIRLLGRGGMGSVYQALDERLKRKVALKMINNLVQSNPRMVERFLREAQSVARLNHPNIITIYDVGEENNCPYIAMQLVEGGNLEITEPWPIPRAAELVEKLAKAMDYVHQHGIIHRDLKPSNIIMDQRGEPYILDFGLARFTEEGEQSVSIEGTVMGTPAFMAPEQARGDLDLVGPATDVYALGGILYVLLTGHHPFEGPIHALLYKVVNDNPPPLRTYRFDVPADLEKICLRCLEKDPSRRYASGADLADALRRCFLTPHLPNEEVKPDPVSSAASSGSENQLEKRTTAPLETSRPGFWRRLRSLFRF